MKRRLRNSHWVGLKQPSGWEEIEGEGEKGEAGSTRAGVNSDSRVQQKGPGGKGFAGGAAGKRTRERISIPSEHVQRIE